jgi:RHH-type proline utilization regulon transcriptional repressor/proline dehydrogenase/delta 1-pyrroline-5-carboxylate dehydrogenase
VYDDPAFMRTLADAATSLPWGSAWEPANVVTPLIAPPRDVLLRALTSLEPGESWLVEPRRDAKNPRAYSPGIKVGVSEGGFMHMTELFGPVLALMRADDLDHALRIANATAYGLTAGLFSLDEREQQFWAARMQAGNLYVNRAITGAIVRRQPFGGYKASGFGPGAKAGGPNYVAQLCDAAQRRAPSVVCPPEPAAAALIVSARDALSDAQREKLGIGACNYAHALRTHFALDHDPSGVLGERNVFRYRPCTPLLVRAAPGADPADVLLCAAAALTAGVEFVLSVAEGALAGLPALERLHGVIAVVEDAAAAAARIDASTTRVRVAGAVEPEIRAAAEAALVHVVAAPVLLSGRFELLHYHREQSLSHRFHRYGNLAGAWLLPPLHAAMPAHVDTTSAPAAAPAVASAAHVVRAGDPGHGAAGE